MVKLAANEKNSSIGGLKKALLSYDERRWSRIRVDTLRSVANLPDGGEQWFWNRFRLVYHAAHLDSPLVVYRDRLRKIWSGNQEEMEDALNLWVRQATLGNRQSWLLASGLFYRVVPNYHILPLSLAIAVSELAPKMAVCQNPECAAPYFLKKRKDQKICERGECTRWKQQQWANDWWKREGQLRRESKRKPSKRS